jgi:uncharacterized membrane protein
MATTEQSGSGDSVGGETETDLDENVAAALSYALGFITGIIMFIVESENDHVRFHAAQSIVVSGALFVVSMGLDVIQAVAGFIDILGLIVGFVFGLINLVLLLGGFVLWIYLLVRTYQGENPRIPVAAGIADGFV